MTNTLIPKILHFIWVGDKEMPHQWVDSWRERNPDMDIWVWTETTINALGLKNADKYRHYMYRKNYAGAADVARVEILYRWGGVYVDIDSICLKPIGDAWFMSYAFFVGYEYDKRIGNGIIGSTPQHPILREYILGIKDLTILDPACYTVGGTMLTSCVAAHGADELVAILPQQAFYPKLKKWSTYKDGEVYCRQLFAGTKGLYV